MDWGSSLLNTLSTLTNLPSAACHSRAPRRVRAVLSVTPLAKPQELGPLTVVPNEPP
jgi:hypothetical protein